LSCVISYHITSIAHNQYTDISTFFQTNIYIYLCIYAQLILGGGRKVSGSVDVVSRLHRAELAPSCKLDSHEVTVKPVLPGKVQPLGERDTLHDGAVLYALNQTYEFEHTDAEQSVRITFPAVNGILYESRFSQQFFTLCDPSGRCVHVGDAWPEDKKLACKGTYKVSLQLRHPTVSVRD